MTPRGVPETPFVLGYDPQTAGGLLVTLPAEQGAALGAEVTGPQLFILRRGNAEEGAGGVPARG